ncbi:MAG: autotransporter domain-containing protein, partial [Myxococcales bacterium]|nr:autotransporter domain-containing protein [Myxococcales bacterium]
LGGGTKSGSGTLSLSGINTFTGLTSIMGGRLDVDGSLAGGVYVGASTVLGGTGSIGGLVDVDGTVAPGNSIGVLTVGSIIFASDSVFEVEVDEPSGMADHLIVDGDADIGGASLQIIPGAGSYAVPVEVTILTTTGTGTILNDFASFDPQFAFLTIEYDKTATTIDLTVVSNGMTLSDFAQTPNQSTIAIALEAAQMAGLDPDIDTVFDNFNKLTEKQVSVALDSMTGESLTQFAATRLATAERFGHSLDARIRDHQWESNDAFVTTDTETREASHLSADRLRPESKAIFGVAMLGVGPMGAPSVGADAGGSRIRAWIDGSGTYGDVDGNSDESGFDYTIWSGSLGVDTLLAEHWVLGLAGGYANTDLDFSSRPGDGEVDTYQGAVYAGYVDPRFHVGVSGRYAYNEIDGKRDIRFGAISRTASADMNGRDYGARFEGGLNLLKIGGIVFQPTASVNYSHLTQDDVTENGAGSLNLALEDFDVDSLVTGAGLRVRGRWNMESDFWMVAELHGRWLHEFLDTDRFIEARLVSAPVGASSFQIQGVELPRDSGSVGLSWSVHTDSDWSIIGSYDIVLNEDLMQHIGSVTLNFAW